MSRRQYPFHLIEPKWQAKWDAEQTFRAFNPGQPVPDGHPFGIRHSLAGKSPASAELPRKFYILDMFPYPSGAGLHVGHPEGYTATDILARYRRAQGFNVLHPMGWDSFGLPAEQYAVKTGQHPRKTTEENISNFTRQIKSLGFSYDWSREVATTDPEYFRWTQWIFLQIYNSWFNLETNRAEPISTLKYPTELQGKDPLPRVQADQQAGPAPAPNLEARRRAYRDSKRLAFVSEAPVNWCPELGTVLANEEVIDGKSEVGGFPVVRKPMRQWMLRITAFAERLLADLDTIDWSDSLKEMQRNWIGRSEGAEVEFQIPNSKFQIRVFTTRPDTLFGATYMVLSPEHALVKEITTKEHAEAVKRYQQFAAGRSDLERTELAKEKTGVFTGAYATNTVNGEKIPIWIADYVLASYGTGAIMAVPAHDTRDFEFATKFNLPIIQVVQPPDPSIDWQGFTDEGTSVNSGFIDGLPTAEAKKTITAWLEEKGLGKKTINYKLRDWLFSRQRYWGEPFPIVWKRDAAGNLQHEAVPEKSLPVLPPVLDDYKPTADGQPPLARAQEWVQLKSGAVRETNTMPQWAGSCWYYLRYLDTANGRRFASREAERYWMGSERTAGMVPLIQAVEWPKIARNLTERAFDDGKRPPFAVEFSRVSDDLAARIRQLCGEDVSDFRHSLDVYAVRHAFREHGIGPLEATRGNIAITIEDIERLPEILEHPDSVSFDDVHKPGCKRFVITKRINGIIFVVEEEKSRRGQLQVVTFWKKKATARDVTTRAPLSNTSENDRRSEATKSTDQSAVKPTPGVDLYVGGTEHAVLHLLYARFWHKVLYDLGHVSTPEPFFKLVNQGLILGELEFFAFAPSGRLPEGFVSSELVKDIKEQAGTLVGTHKATGETMVGRKLSGHEKDVEKRGEHFYLKLQSQIRVEARSFKMSKARGNVVNPDEVVREFGADSLRLYEMFMGPLQDTKPWNTNGVEGVYRFLGRVWRLFIDEKAETAFEQAETTTPAPTDELLDILVLNGAISDMAAAPAQLKALHACIKKVTEDLDGMRFNTAISAMMVFVNEANTWQTRPLPLMRTFLQLLAPFAPHVAEELWSRLHSTFGQVAPSLIYAPWPKFDPSLLVESEIEIPVSVNGKLRDLIRVATDADSSTLEAAARSAEKVKPYLEGKTVKKVIVVPRKMVNIVVT